MEINEYQEIMSRDSSLSKEEELVYLGLNLISVSGSISGNIQQIVYEPDIEKKKQNADNLKENIVKNLDILMTVCNLINLDLDSYLQTQKKDR